MDKDVPYFESFLYFGTKIKNLVINNIPSSINFTETQNNKDERIHNKSKENQIKENIDTTSTKQIHYQTSSRKNYLKRYELNAQFHGIFLIFSMVTEATEQNLQQKYFSEIAQLLGFNTIENTNCTSVKEITEKLHKYNDKGDKHDVCFAIALIVHEKDTRFTEAGGMKKIFDELLILNIQKDVPKLVFIEPFRGGNYEIEEGSITNNILSYEIKNTFVAYSTINNTSINQNEMYCSTFTKKLLDEVKNNGLKTEIHKLLTRVNKSVAEDESTQIEQFSSFRSSLIKELYFNK